MTNITGIPERQIHIYTGIKGMDMISHAFAVNNSVDYAKFLKDKNKITEEELNNITNMLMSNDRDNFEVALLALEQLGK
jgi:hypothetical protein